MSYLSRAEQQRQRRFYVLLTVGMAAWAAFVGWVAFEGGQSLAMNQPRYVFPSEITVVLQDRR